MDHAEQSRHRQKVRGIGQLALVSSYLGIKTTGDAKDTVERAQRAQQSKTSGGSSNDTA